MTEKASTDHWRSRFMGTTFLYKGEELLKRGSLIEQAITLAGPKDRGFRRTRTYYLRIIWLQLGPGAVKILQLVRNVQ